MKSRKAYTLLALAVFLVLNTACIISDLSIDQPTARPEELPQGSRCYFQGQEVQCGLTILIVNDTTTTVCIVEIGPWVETGVRIEYGDSEHFYIPPKAGRYPITVRGCSREILHRGEVGVTYSSEEGAYVSDINTMFVRD